MVAGAMASALACYTVSLRVSAERADVESIRRQIASDLRDIRALEAELRTRSRLPQLQRWNDEVLAMVPPTAKQFAGSPTMLVAYAPNQPARPAAQEPVVQFAVASEAAVPMEAPIRTVAYTSGPRPAATAPARPQPLQLAAAKPVKVTVEPVQLAKVESAPAPKATPKAAPKAKPAPKPLPETVTAALAAVETPAAKAIVKSETKPRKAAEAAPVRLAGLSASLIGEIESAAAAERRGFRKVAMQ